MAQHSIVKICLMSEFKIPPAIPQFSVHVHYLVLVHICYFVYEICSLHMFINEIVSFVLQRKENQLLKKTNLNYLKRNKGN